MKRGLIRKKIDILMHTKLVLLSGESGKLSFGTARHARNAVYHLRTTNHQSITSPNESSSTSAVGSPAASYPIQEGMELSCIDRLFRNTYFPHRSPMTLSSGRHLERGLEKPKNPSIYLISLVQSFIQVYKIAVYFYLPRTLVRSSPALSRTSAEQA